MYSELLNGLSKLLMTPVIMVGCLGDWPIISTVVGLLHDSGDKLRPEDQRARTIITYVSWLLHKSLAQANTVLTCCYIPRCSLSSLSLTKMARRISSNIARKPKQRVSKAQKLAHTLLIEILAYVKVLEVYYSYPTDIGIDTNSLLQSDGTWALCKRTPV